MKQLFLIFLFFVCVHYTNAQTVDTFLIHNMERSVADGTYPKIHSILVSRNDSLVYEKYWPNNDIKEKRGWAFAIRGMDTLHTAQSMSKSVTSACIGIAIAHGKIKGIHQKIFDFFPEYAMQDTGLKSLITIKDLLTMTAGFKWSEDDYTRPDNNENLMSNSPDPVAYVLSRPMASVPGKTFVYNGGATELLSAIIQKATGKTLDKFANEYLFTPLGITNFYWRNTDSSNVLDAYGGLFLTSRDCMKFGLLYMNDGNWNGKQIIAKDWVEQSITPFVVADDGSDIRFGKSEYGFQWWLFGDTVRNKPITVSACVGYGGQRIFVDKENKLVVVFTGGNYGIYDAYLNPYKILNEFIYPAFITNK